METYRCVDKELHDNILKKGFGFIAKDDGSGDLFCHYSNIISDGFKSLEQGQRVEFELGANHKGSQCINVKVLTETTHEFNTQE